MPPPPPHEWHRGGPPHPVAALARPPPPPATMSWTVISPPGWQHSPHTCDFRAISPEGDVKSWTFNSLVSLIHLTKPALTSKTGGRTGIPVDARLAMSLCHAVRWDAAAAALHRGIIHRGDAQGCKESETPAAYAFGKLNEWNPEVECQSFGDGAHSTAAPISRLHPDLGLTITFAPGGMCQKGLSLHTGRLRP